MVSSRSVRSVNEPLVGSVAMVPKIPLFACYLLMLQQSGHTHTYYFIPYTFTFLQGHAHILVHFYEYFVSDFKFYRYSRPTIITPAALYCTYSTYTPQLLMYS